MTDMKWLVSAIICFSFLTLLAQKVEGINQGGNKTFKNLYKINDSLYRGELPTNIGGKELEKLGVKSFLNLRFFRSDRRAAKGTNVKLYREHINAWVMSEGEIIDALKLIQQAPKPLLIHCVHGSDRTGTIVAAYRIVFEGWTKEEAIKELLEPKYGFHPCFQNLIFLLNHLDVEKVKRELNLI